MQRKLGKYINAGKITEEVLDIDILDHWVRNECYLLKKHTDRLKEVDEELAGKAEVIVAKQRNGPVGTAELIWEKEYTRFHDRAPRL